MRPALLLFCLAGPALAAPPLLKPSALDPDAVHARLEVPAPGRYTLTARSTEGTALRLVDRMAGTIERAGVAGASDGRIDAFLDAGEYRVLVERAEKATGRIELAAHHVAATGPERRLEEFAPRETTLVDGQARAWWIRLDTDRTVVLEGAGRALSTLRIWRDGRWLDAAEPRCANVQPHVGRAVRRCTLTARLTRGLHRVVAYGGAPLDWTEGAAPGADTLFVRWGVPKLAPAGARRFIVGPSGIARFQVPAGVSRTVLALAAPGKARLSVAPWTADRPFSRTGRTARIAHDARAHVAELVRVERPAYIEVEAAPGTAATLRWFPHRAQDELVGPGDWLVGSVHANDDGPPPTGVLYRTLNGRPVIAGESVIQVGPGAPLRHTFNLSGSADLFMRVTADMTVRAAATGARMRLIPLWVRAPDGYRSPDLAAQLDQVVTAGLYRLTLVPDRQAITTLTVHAADAPAPTADTLVPKALDFGRVTLGQGERRSVMHAHGPVHAATTIADAPVAIDAGLPLSLAPGATRVIPIVDGPGRISAVALDGTQLEVSLDGTRWQARVDAAKGAVHVRNPSAQWVTGAIRRVPDSATGAPLPPVSKADRALLPDLPELKAGQRTAVTMERSESRSWRLKVPVGGAWLIESTGLLATAGHLRTRTRTSLTQASTMVVATTRRTPPPQPQFGASGRNFGIGRYLRAGEYLVTARTTGGSKGRMGLRLSATTVRDEGELVVDRLARARAEPGEAVAWRFTLAEETKVRLHAEAPEGVLRCRVEDADGWPLDPPESRCSHVHTLAAGTWRVIVLPTRAGGLRRVRYSHTVDRTIREGAGPHAINLGETVEARWTEPGGDAPRAPQVFRFEMPAEGEVHLDAPADMVVEIHDAQRRVARVSPGRRFDGTLAAGPHTVRVVGARRDDGVRYTFSLEPQQLLPGLTRTVTADGIKARATAVIPATGLYTFTTDGAVDARLRLMDADGATLALQDDRPDDWNARITRRLTPGRYTVEVELAQRWESTTLGLNAVRPVDGPAIALGQRPTVKPTVGGSVHPITGTGDVIAARIEAGENVGVALEVADGDGWRTLAASEGRTPVVAIRPGAGAHRLRVWSLDGLERPATVSLSALSPWTIAEAAWQRGATLPVGRLAAVTPLVGVGAFVIAPSAGTLVCPRVGAGCTAARPGGLPIAAEGVRFVGFGGRISGRRMRADEATGPTLSVTGRARIDLPRGQGPVVFEARAPIGQPAVALGDGPQGIVRGRALAVDLGGKARQGVVWSSDGQPLNTRLRAWRLVQGEARTLATGRNRLTLAPGTAVAAVMPSGPRRLRALLPRGGLVVMPRLDGTAALGWGAAGPVVDGARGVADTVHLLNPAATPAVFELEVIADASGAPAPIAFNAPFETRTVRSGVARLTVAAEAGARLNLRGATGSFARADGQIFWIDDGGSAPVDGGGQLVLRHGVGPVLAWIGSPARPGPWATDPEVSPRAIATTRQIPLTGPAQRFTIAWPEPRMLHLRVAGDVVLRAERAGGATTVLFGGAHDLWLPEGGATLTVRGLGGSALAGELLVASSVPTTLTEGVGAPTLLGPGDTRLYRFETTRKAAIGVGIRADADRVRASVYDLEGTLVAAGGSVMPELTAGEWLLALHLPADAAPVEARPALIGIAPRGDGPPASTIRSYVENAR